MRLVQPTPSEWTAALTCSAWMAAWLLPATPWGPELAAATAAALLFMCRYTVLAALAMAALELAGTLAYSSEENPASLVPLLATFYFLARYVASARRGLLVGGVVLYSSMVGSVHDPQSAIFGLILVSGPFVFGRIVRRRALVAERAQAAAASLAKLDAAAVAERAIADERGRLGGQALSVIRASVEQMIEDASLAARTLDPVLIDRISERGRAAVMELRWLLGLLRTNPQEHVAEHHVVRRLPWRMEAVTALGVSLVYLSEAVIAGPPTGNALAWMLPVAFPLPLAFRQRNPGIACVAVAVMMTLSTALSLPFLYGFTLGPTITFALLAWSVATDRRRWGWAGLGVLLAAVVYRFLLDQPGGIPVVIALFAMPALAGYEWNTRDRDRRAAEAREGALAADLHSNIDRAVRSERLRIARELHDVTSHAVGVMVLQASAGHALCSKDPEGARTALANVEFAGKSALAEVAALFRVLDAGAIGSPGLTASPVESLEELAARMRTAGLQVSLVNEAPAVPEELSRTIYRIVQEALTNAARHAPGAGAIVKVSDHGTSIVVDVTNDVPQPARPNGGAGFGLAGVRERVTNLGGTLEVSRTVGTFTVAACLPVPKAMP